MQQIKLRPKCHIPSGASAGLCKHTLVPLNRLLASRRDLVQLYKGAGLLTMLATVPKRFVHVLLCGRPDFVSSREALSVSERPAPSGTVSLPKSMARGQADATEIQETAVSW